MLSVTSTPNWLRASVAWTLSHLCAATRHAGGCALLNSHWYLFYDEQADRYRIETRNRLTFRLWLWAIS